MSRRSFKNAPGFFFLWAGGHTVFKFKRCEDIFCGIPARPHARINTASHCLLIHWKLMRVLNPLVLFLNKSIVWGTIPCVCIDRPAWHSDSTGPVIGGEGGSIDWRQHYAKGDGLPSKVINEQLNQGANTGLCNAHFYPVSPSHSWFCPALHSGCTWRPAYHPTLFSVALVSIFSSRTHFSVAENELEPQWYIMSRSEYFIFNTNYYAVSVT